MSRPLLVPLAVWMVAVSPAATLALPGRAAVAVPTRSFQPLRSTAAPLAFCRLIVVSVGLSCAPAILTGEAAVTVAAAGEAAAAAVAAGEAAAAAAVAAGETAGLAAVATCVAAACTVGLAGAAPGAQAARAVRPAAAARRLNRSVSILKAPSPAKLWASCTRP